jgi:hypothetical protein
MSKPWVYIASPYTKGDVAINVRTQMEAFDTLLTFGVVPIAPLYSHYQHIFLPRPYQDWIDLDIEVIQRCDACLRAALGAAGSRAEDDGGCFGIGREVFGTRHIACHTRAIAPDGDGAFLYALRQRGRAFRCLCGGTGDEREGEEDGVVEFWSHGVAE